MQLFKGYVPTKDKKCLKPFKGKTTAELDTYEQVKGLPEFAGILGGETILIDIDDASEGDILFEIVKAQNLKCRVYQTTRGKHFLFQNHALDTCKTGCKLAIALNSDIKVGCKSSYSILKFEKVEREILYDVPEDEIQEVPKWLHPIKMNMEFMTMEAGDGRNQALFNYILTLQANDFTVEEARETIHIINKHVLKVPLKDSELETILRDDSFKKPIFYKGTAFLFDKFAVFLKNNHHIIKLNNQLHLYKEGVYLPDSKNIESAMIQHLPGLSRAKRIEVMAYLPLICEACKPSDANLLAFNNGVYNIKDDSFVPFSPETIITNKVTWDYNPAAYLKVVDDVLNKISCQDEKIRMLLEEMIGYCFYRRNELGKAFILIGEGSNGKSTFLDMVKTLLGQNNIASLDMKQLGEKFKTAELFGKLANIGDDIHDGYIEDNSVFKKLVTGEQINVEKKGQDPFEFNNYSKLFFSANNIPRMKDRTQAVLRRLIIIPFNAKFTADDSNFKPYIKYDLQKAESMEYLIQLGINGLKRVLQNKGFTSSEKVKRELDEYEEINNPIIGFYKEIGNDAIENEATNRVYRQYCEYCLNNGLVSISNIQFSREICRNYGFEAKNKRIGREQFKTFIKRD